MAFEAKKQAFNSSISTVTIGTGDTVSYTHLTLPTICSV